MKKKKRGLGSDLAKVDAHTIRQKEYAESPEWTDGMFERADLYAGGKRIKRGRPKKSITAKATTLRLDPEVERRFRATGKGWQTRINAALREWLRSHH